MRVEGKSFEDLPHLRMQRAVTDQRINGAILFERGIELNEGFRPEFACFECLFDLVPNIGVVNINEALDVVLVAFQNFGVKGEGIHDLVYSASLLVAAAKDDVRTAFSSWTSERHLKNSSENTYDLKSAASTSPQRMFADSQRWDSSWERVSDADIMQRWNSDKVQGGSLRASGMRESKAATLHWGMGQSWGHWYFFGF